MDARGLLVGAALPVPVAQGGEGEHERGEPLLAVDHEPALYATRGDPARRKDHRSHEMRGRLPAVQMVFDQFQYVVPQLPQLFSLPAVSALIQRNLELLLTLDDFAERGLLRVHASPPDVVPLTAMVS
ncbi:hypothetical protein GCM10010500_16030 [Streptomyces nigrescens]|nr:hypothetical protein GCM10010500_16030 [Streptomyces libani subsp. libani]